MDEFVGDPNTDAAAVDRMWGSRLDGAAQRSVFFFSSRRRHTRCSRDWSSDVCSSDLGVPIVRGRGFLPGETHDSPGVVVTGSTARRLWPDEDALAKTLRESRGREYSVIGDRKSVV